MAHRVSRSAARITGSLVTKAPLRTSPYPLINGRRAAEYCVRVYAIAHMSSYIHVRIIQFPVILAKNISLPAACDFLNTTILYDILDRFF